MATAKSTRGILTWTNPTATTEGKPYDHAAQGAGYEVALADSEGALIEAELTLPFALGTQFDLGTWDQYRALPYGQEAVIGLRVVTREGERSAWAVITFRKVAVPLAPAAVALD